MRLIIAEKPSIAKAIAKVLGGTSFKDGYIDCKNDTKITWCFGHLLEQCTPEDYGHSQWKMEGLPIFPAEWQLKERSDKGVKKQLSVIKNNLKQADQIINAGDPDREGQLLVDEILDFFNSPKNKEVQRIWLASLDEESVKIAFSKIESNKKYLPLKNAALARSRADWMIGMNLTRAMTLSAREKAGSRQMISVGRVQTPTLALVVNRDREYENFVPVDYYIPTIIVEHTLGQFGANWIPQEDSLGIDDQSRLIDKKIAQELVNKTEGKTGKIVKANSQKKKKNPDLPYDLSSLQKEAYSKFGINSTTSLKIVQSLYERKITTYPRTDCRYLPEEQFKSASSIIKNIQKNLNIGQEANSGIKSPAWNTKKVEAHHAIIPTGQMDNLAENEFKIYTLIAKGYLRQFYSAMEYLSQQVIIYLAEEYWKATGKRILEPGWTVLEKTDNKQATNKKQTKDKQEKDAQSLPEGLKKDDSVKRIDGYLQSKKTTPPPRFNDVTLVEAMGKIHLYVSEPEIKKRLKENSGLGTVATRTGIVQTLTKRGFLEKKGKNLISTEIGRGIIDTVPEVLSDPGVTALWEDYLEDIAKSKRDLNSFLEKQQGIVQQLIEDIKDINFSGTIFEKIADDTKDKNGETHSCPECGNSLQRRKSKKGKWYWVCFNKAKHDSGEPVFMPDNKGKPGKANNNANSKKSVCPDCGQDMFQRQSKKNSSFYFWACKSGKCSLRYDNNGEPGEKMEFGKSNKKDS